MVANHEGCVACIDEYVLAVCVELAFHLLEVVVAEDEVPVQGMHVGYHVECPLVCVVAVPDGRLYSSQRGYGPGVGAVLDGESPSFRCLPNSVGYV